MNKSEGWKQSRKQVLAFPGGLSGHITSTRLIKNSTFHPFLTSVEEKKEVPTSGNMIQAFSVNVDILGQLNFNYPDRLLLELCF